MPLVELSGKSEVTEFSAVSDLQSPGVVDCTLTPEGHK